MAQCTKYFCSRFRDHLLLYYCVYGQVFSCVSIARRFLSHVTVTYKSDIAEGARRGGISKAVVAHGDVSEVMNARS